MKNIIFHIIRNLKIIFKNLKNMKKLNNMKKYFSYYIKIKNDKIKNE